MAGSSANPRARFLGAELRAVREERNVSLRTLAKELGVGHAKLSLLERGETVPKIEDVSAILARLNITGEDRERLLEMARQAEDPNWIAVGVPGISEVLSAYMEFERTSIALFEWCPFRISGLLQTGDYARGILSKYPLADTRVAMRLGRADILDRRNPVSFTAVIAETALRRPVGGDPAVMVDQLNHVLDAIKKPNVTVQVMPEDGDHPAMMSAFTLMQFAKLKPLVFHEHFRGSNFVVDDDDVADYVEATEQVAAIAMSPAESAKLIERVIPEYGD